MTRQQIVGLGVRLFAIWLAVRAIPYLVAFQAVPAEQSPPAVSVYLVVVAYTIVAVLLWFFPMTIAHKLVPRTQFAEPLRVPAFEAARVGCALLGLLLLIQSGPGLVSLVFRGYVVSGSDAIFSGLSSDQKVDIGIYSLEILIAILLLARSSSFARFITREAAAKDGDA
jgi:hypothetical protein